MKVNLYLLTLLTLFFTQYGRAQDCSTLAATYTTNESRCVATGFITVNVTGGSGNYNYKAIGPITTPTTSSNIITGLPPGTYTVQVKDLGTGCTKDILNVVINGSYDDPRFQLTKVDAGCSGNDGSVSVINQQFGRSPFSFTIVSPSPSQVGNSNNTGNFTGLTAGEYVIELRDSCGGVQVRRITIENYSWWFDNIAVNRFGCDSAHVALVLRDNKGNLNTSGTAFSGFTYGYERTPGDTVWTNSPNFNAWTGTNRKLVIVSKDNCGNIHSSVWFLPAGLKPSLGSVTQTSFTCAGFAASVTGTNLTNPQYCLFDNANNQIACNTTGNFTGLAYGSYCIKATDLCYDTVITRCFTGSQPVPSVAATVAISARACATFTATITGQANLTSPNYCLYDATHTQISCNTTGVFTSVPYGDYCIEVTDGCGGAVIQRCFTVARLTPSLTSYAVTGSTCTGFNVSVTGNNLQSPNYCLYDDQGNVVACNSTGIFTGIPHGNYCIRATSCGDVTNSLCFGTAPPVPAVGAVNITNKTCTTFDAAITGQLNLTSPQYCLYDNTNTVVSCNTTGIFTAIPYGDYCIKVDDGCVDTIITRCFTQVRDVPSVSATIQTLSSTCTTVSFKVNGTNLRSPNYCLYDIDDNLLECNINGSFSNYPYGSYCVVVTDGCTGTVFKVCQTFAPARGISLSTSKPCTLGMTYLDVQFANGSSPYNIRVVHPNGSDVYNASSATATTRLTLPALPVGGIYKVVGTDNCGNKDSATIVPDGNVVTTTTSVRSKCPSSVWTNGAGDLSASYTSNYYSMIPQVIKKDNAAFVRSYSSSSGNNFTFSDLEPATYVIEYTQQNCNAKKYDTVTVAPYAYPSQGQSAIYQCDNNSFSLGADVAGGVSPFSYQIIGSQPETPNISTAPQNSAVFNINNGTTYSLVRLRSVDACGNGTLSDVSVLPLQNISIAADTLCFYQNVTLSVDSIPNASYSWYIKASNNSTDSTLIGAGNTYNLPFFKPEETGIYVVRVNVNSGCATRVTSFRMDGNCGQSLLPINFRIKGKQNGSTNEIFWSNPEEKEVIGYTIESNWGSSLQFKPIGYLKATRDGGTYRFEDKHPGAGSNRYRVKVHYPGKEEYTKQIALNLSEKAMSVYPNPVKDIVHIALGSTTTASYRLELIGTNGQVISYNEMRDVQSHTIDYHRADRIPPGVYLLRVTNMEAGTFQVFRLRFE